MEIRPLNATALIITWEPPPPYAANGIIVAYTLRFTEVETRETERVERNGQQTVLTVSSLHPYYHYGVSISSNTSVGEGPYSDPVMTRLPQDGMAANELGHIAKPWREQANPHPLPPSLTSSLFSHPSFLV